MRGLFVLICLSLVAMLIVGGGVDQHGFPKSQSFNNNLQTSFSTAVNSLAVATVFGGATTTWLMAALGMAMIGFFRSILGGQVNSYSYSYDYGYSYSF